MLRTLRRASGRIVHTIRQELASPLWIGRIIAAIHVAQPQSYRTCNLHSWIATLDTPASHILMAIAQGVPWGKPKMYHGGNTALTNLFFFFNQYNFSNGLKLYLKFRFKQKTKSPTASFSSIIKDNHWKPTAVQCSHNTHVK